MWYHVSLPVPAGTAETDPVEAEIKLTHGVIKYIGIGFPTGCKQQVKVRLYHQEHQIFPANPDEPASWNGGIEGGEEHYKLEEAPFMLTVRAYAPTATVAHTLTVFVLLLPVEVAEPWREQISLLDRIKNVFGLG
jgi:hypothetical protein